MTIVLVLLLTCISMKTFTIFITFITCKTRCYNVKRFELALSMGHIGIIINTFMLYVILRCNVSISMRFLPPLVLPKRRDTLLLYCYDIKCEFFLQA